MTDPRFPTTLPGGHAHSKTPEWEDSHPPCGVSMDHYVTMEASLRREIANWQAALATALITIVVTAAVVSDTRGLINPPCGRLPLPSYSGQAR